MNNTAQNTEASIARVLKYTGLFGGVQGLYVLIGIIRNKLTSILLGTGGIGLIEMYNRTAELIGNSTNMGISFSAVQHISELYDKASSSKSQAVDSSNIIKGFCPKEDSALVHYICLVRSWILFAALLGFVVTIVFSPLWAFFSLGSMRHTSMVIALGPLIALLTLNGGELAILRGLRQVKTIALITAVGGLTTLGITIPIYWWLGSYGIVPALVLSTAIILAMQLFAAHRVMPYQVKLNSWKFLRRGNRMIRLGFSYILTGIICSGCELLVRSFIVHFGNMGDVGLFAAGFTLTVTYTRLILTSMDSDYYPRLSATAGNPDRINVTVNRQIDVLALLMAPLLIIFCLSIPILMPTLYTKAFLDAVPMVYAAALYMYFKAVAAPIAYLALAHSRSKLYLYVESSYSITFLFTAIAGYSLWGIIGVGAGLSISNAAYLLIVWWVYGKEFGFHFEKNTLRRCLVQFVFLVAGLSSCGASHPWIHYGMGFLIFLLSTLYSWQLFHKEIALPTRLQRWFKQ